MRPILVLVGAGASHASGDYAEAEAPPLTTQLFDVNRSQGLLKSYTLALAAGSAIEREMRGDNTLEFEAALRRLQEDGHAHHRQMAVAVPPYLQALLLNRSETLATESSRYLVLVDELLKLEATKLFVSLNYDTLLDRHLAAYSPLDGPQDYVDPASGWCLLKPHGSVTWYVEQPQMFDPRTPARDLEIVRAPIRCLPMSHWSLSRIRGTDPTSPHGPTTRYPAIALPDGPKDELVWPTEHGEFFTQSLKRANEIDVLVLGYSALDTEILKLILQADCTVRRMTVVNKSGADALEVFDRIVRAGVDPIWPDVFPESFKKWVDAGALRTWVEEYEGPFDSATSPDELRQSTAVLLRQQLRHIRELEQDPSTASD